jgi:hypothetical protein
MKTKLITIIALALLCGCSRSIPSSEAARHIGEHCTVEGYVASVHATGRGTVFLNFDNAYETPIKPCNELCHLARCIWHK